MTAQRFMKSTSNWVPPLPLRQPPPRRPRPSGIFMIQVVLFSLVMLLPLREITRTLLDIRSLNAIKESGAPTTGTISDLYYNTHHGRGGSYNLYYVDYIYHQPQSDFVHSTKNYLRTAQISVEEYQNMRIHETVPVIYDPKHPDDSRLAFERAPGTFGDPPDAPGRSIYIAFGIVAAVLAIIPIMLIRDYLRIKWLLTWGLAAQATIVDTEEKVGRSGRYLNVTFQFVDADGQTILGIAKGISAGSGQASFAEIQQNPTVVYDRGDSDNNFLYRKSLAYFPTD